MEKVLETDEASVQQCCASQAVTPLVDGDAERLARQLKALADPTRLKLLSIVAARRLGSTLSSFVGLSEVLFAVLIAWALLGETPGPGTVVGGALILGGVVAVRFGELWTRRQDDSAAGTDPGLPRRPRAVHAP